jgi:2-iminobutanoate/2-iminopropanoate deaminase
MAGKIECFESISGAPQAVGPYSPAVRVGNLVFLSGQVGLNPATSQLVGAGIEEQTKQVLNNLKSVLAGVGLSFKDVAKSVIFLTDLSNFQTVNKIYGEALEGHKPARSTIQVSALPLGAIVEIEMVAVDSQRA